MDKFNFNEIDDFDEHINLSIPNYNWLIEQIQSYSKYFIDEHTNVYDLGCSTGKLLKSINSIPNVNYYGIDNSNLLPQDGVSNTHFLDSDLLEYEEIRNASLIFSIFTIQFLPACKRKLILQRIKDGLNKNGAFILCEKTYSSSSRLQDITNSLYYEFKQKNFPVEEILEKERKLRRSLKLNQLEDIMAELKCIGNAEIFWRSYNFVGIIVIKE